MSNGGKDLVLGLEQFSVANALGSSHGASRIIRLVYQEHSSYVTLLQYAYPLWRALEHETGRQILTTTGVVNISAPTVFAYHGHSTFSGALASATAHNLDHQVFTPHQFHKLHPVFDIPSNYGILLDPAGGVLNPELGIQSFVSTAVQSHGAHVRTDSSTGSSISSWKVVKEPSISTTISMNSRGTYQNNNNSKRFNNDGLIHITTTDGAVIETKTLVLSAGMWMLKLVPELHTILKIERQVLGWFKPPPDAIAWYQNLPSFLIDNEHGDYYYGFPQRDPYGLKIGKYNHLKEHYKDPEQVDRHVHLRDEDILRKGLKEYLPGLSAAPMTKAVVCTFTNSSDGHFILDQHPKHGNVVLCSACSGHGYKFAPVLGEILADLTLQSGQTEYDVALHRIDGGRPGHGYLLQEMGV